MAGRLHSRTTPTTLMPARLSASAVATAAAEDAAVPVGDRPLTVGTVGHGHVLSLLIRTGSRGVTDRVVRSHARARPAGETP